MLDKAAEYLAEIYGNDSDPHVRHATAQLCASYEWAEGWREFLTAAGPRIASRHENLATAACARAPGFAPPPSIEERIEALRHKDGEEGRRGLRGTAKVICDTCEDHADPMVRIVAKELVRAYDRPKTWLRFAELRGHGVDDKLLGTALLAADAARGLRHGPRGLR
jgi:hypothetical protein